MTLKIKMAEAGAGYGPRGTIEGWQAGQVIELDERDARQRAWADHWLASGATDVTKDPEAIATPTDTGRAGVRRGAK
jgi:hypothetical protein